MLNPNWDKSQFGTGGTGKPMHQIGKLVIGFWNNEIGYVKDSGLAADPRAEEHDRL